MAKPKTEPTAERVKRLRTNAGLSITTVAESCDLDRTTLWKIEKNKRQRPSLETMTALACFYKLTVGQVRGTEALP